MKPFTLYDDDAARLTGERVYALGFPGSADRLFESTGSIADDVTITDGIIGAVRNSIVVGTGERPVSTLQMNVSIFFGNSGGPLLNEKGVVVGINTFGSAEDTNMTGAVSVSELFPMLDQNGIPYKTSSNPLYSGIMWIIIAIVAITFILLYLLVFRKNMQAKSTTRLSSYLAKNTGQFQYDAMIRMLMPVISQLADMENHAQLHLAVYPQNIIVQKSNTRAVLLPARKQELVNGFSAPEQYKTPPQTGNFTDVYQLGAIMYRMLTGETLPDVLTRMEDDSTAQAKIDMLDLSSDQKQGLKLALSLNADVRISNVAQLVSTLRLDQIPEYFETYQPAKKARQPLTQKKKRKIVAFSVLGGIIVVVAVGAGWFVGTYNTAMDYIIDENYVRAEQTLKKLPSINTDIKDLKDFTAAGVLLQNGQYDEARTALQVLDGFPTAAILLPKIDGMQGLALLLDGKIEEGEALIDRYKVSGISEDEIQELDFARAQAYFMQEDYEIALNILEGIDEYPSADDLAKLCHMSLSAECANGGQYLAAYNEVKEYASDPEIQEYMDSLLLDIYNQGIDAFNAGQYLVARDCFTISKSIGEEDAFLAIINATRVSDLKPYLKYQAAIDKLYSVFGLLEDYLIGYWSDGEYYFRMNSDFSTEYDIPWLDGPGDYWELDGNIYLSGGTECFRFDVIDWNHMEIFAYANGRTYSFYRQ